MQLHLDHEPLRPAGREVDSDLGHDLDDLRPQMLGGRRSGRLGTHVAGGSKNAWAICERPALWLQTNRTYFIDASSFGDHRDRIHRPDLID
jgi:hypothetical protein